MTGAPRDEDVCRPIVRLGREQRIEAGRNADDDVAEPLADGAADEAAPLRPPSVLESRTELAGGQFGYFVLEALAALVRERQVIGVGAHPELALRAADAFNDE